MEKFDDNFDSEKYEQIMQAIDKRFPDAEFVVSCFKTIEEIENKILLENVEEIIFMDSYILGRKKLYDYYVIKCKNDQKCIYYKDVIDTLIEHGFKRNDCDYRYLERICLIEKNKYQGRNINSAFVFGASWGS